MLVSKKARLIWDENYNVSDYASVEIAHRCIEPNVSFDNGLSWMSLGDIASTLRASSASIDNASTISASTNAEGFNQLDISFGFTPYTVPEISEIEYVAATNGKFAGGTTYYFALMGITYDMPGFYSNETDDSGYYKYYSGNYYNGPVTGSLTGGVDDSGYYPISKLSSVTLPSTANNYNINLYVRYPDICKGLCVYYGTASGDTVTLNLCMLTNLVQRLGEDISETENTVITLNNNYPLPPSGTVLIDGETIGYSSCEWNSNKKKWQLKTLTRYNRAKHVANSGADNDADMATRVYLSMFNGGIHGELPKKIYPKTSVPANCVQLLNFDAETLQDMATHISGEDSVPNTTPTAIGNVGYDIASEPLVNSLRLTSSGAVHCGVNSLSAITIDGKDALTAINTKGTISFYMMLSNFKDGATTDPYVFAPKSGQGLWMRISRFNLKPYIGYRYKDPSKEVYYDIDIANYEDYRLPSLTKNVFSHYVITWESVAQELVTSSLDNSMLDNIKFTYIVDGITILTFESYVHKNKFEMGDIVIGGIVSTANGQDAITDSFIGYIDDWRLYANKTLTRDEAIQLNSENMQQIGIEHSGVIELTNNTVVDYSDANLTTTGTNSLPGTLSTKYEPRLYTQIKVSESSASVGKEYGTYYDSWFIKAYKTDGLFGDINNYKSGGGEESNYTPRNYTYPINPTTIKIKFDMAGPDNNFSSPRIKNIVLMTSEATLD